MAAAGGAEFGAVPSANTVSWPPRDVILQGGIATNGTQALGGFREPGGKTDAGPATDAG